MILEVQKVCFAYAGQQTILKDIDLTLEEGHILAILGPNGIGKTTLLKCMVGLLPWQSGRSLLYGKDIHKLKPKEALMMNRKGEFFYGAAREVLTEKNISYSFDVQVVVNEFMYEGRNVRSIVPVALTEGEGIL